jgi:4'-phosphopantetheinyl transferase
VLNIWFAAAAPYELAAGWTDALWDNKAERIRRMRRREDRALSLTAHRLMCLALKTDCRICPAPSDFGVEERGKPFLKTRPDIHFNISHSGNMAMCALHHAPVGADIEKIRPAGAGVSRRVMTVAEHEAYMRAPDREDFFFAVWTLKEAYIKYLGTGLGLAMSAVTVCPEGWEVQTDTGCAFWMTRDISGYRAAVCTQSGESPKVRMVKTGELASL